ncbi:MAG: DUF1956 domain-containing protein [Deltaproteobacteria bacterium]|nr:MAG: DUF1956 domain-containing protein [Deltaproteobacteria bacterium]
MSERGQDTKTALLEAGGEVFARRGYAEATVREICAKAGANVAAVRYHFGDKAGLYSAVLAYAAECAAARYPLDVDYDPGAPPEDRLRSFVRSFLKRLLDPGRPAWHAAIMVRELAEPTHAFDMVLNDLIRPLFERLASIVRDLLGAGADEDEVRLTTHSIMGQCTFYRQGRFLMPHLYGIEPPGLDQVEHIAEHIVRFSLGALGSGKNGRGQRPGRTRMRRTGS